MSKKTSWQPVHKWYKNHHSEEGGHYHRTLLIPRLLELMDLNPSHSLLDIGCGEGILERKIPKDCNYYGIDSSKDLILSAKKQAQSKKHTFIYADAEGSPYNVSSCTHGVFLLSLQNMSSPLKALKNASKALAKDASLYLVLNHPCFRIPKSSSWGIDEGENIQYRRLDRYQSSFKKLIDAHPSKKNSPKTPSFHYSLQQLFQWISQSGLHVQDFLEISSNKKSYGKKAKMENFARKEFPLFLILHCKKSF